MDQFLATHGLPRAYQDMAERFFDPVIDEIIARQKHPNHTMVIGVNGAQGSGKTTLSDYMVYQFSSYGLNTAAVSLDDFYYSKSRRVELSKRIHPLLRTRGVPGTHEISLLHDTIFEAKNRLKHYSIPRFNKAIDDRAEESEWLSVEDPLDILIIEGWCWGAEHVSESALIKPVNRLESEEDKDLVWRRYVNSAIREQFEPLYSEVDFWLMLKAPSFDCVVDWRNEQEEKLKKKLAEDPSKDASAVMSREDIEKFVQYFQRTTENILERLPSRCDCVWQLDSQRKIQSVSLGNKLKNSELFELRV